MKKAIYIIALALAAIGCAKDETTETIPTDGVISLSAGVVSRVATDEDCTWETGDKVGVFTDQTNEVNLLFQISNTTTGELENKSDKDLHPLLSGTRTYYAYYPYDENQSTTTVAIDCSDQSTLTPLLWATETSNDTSVSLSFTHMYAKVSFALRAGNVDATSLTNATAWLTGAYKTGTFDIKTGEFSFSDDDTAKVDLVINKDDNTISAIYLPPSSGVKLWVNDGENTFLRSLGDWESGGLYDYYDIIVGDADIELKDGVYYINSANGLKAFANLVNNAANTTDATTMGGIEFQKDGGNKDISGQLTRDIDLSTICSKSAGSWTPIGTSFSTPYSGNFDGNGFEVQNLYINVGASNQGLFGYTTSATISNLGVTGEVTITGNYSRCGGIVGCDSYSTIINCYNKATVSGYSNVGGIIGDADEDTKVSNCYNMGKVSGSSYVGGIAGCNNSGSKITNCYSVGEVSGSAQVGGVVGSSNSTISNCYWNKDIYGGNGLGTSSQTGTTGYTSDQMKNNEEIEDGKYFYDILNSNAADCGGCAWTTQSGVYPKLDFGVTATGTN